MATKRIAAIKVERIYDNDADTSYLEQDGFEERLDQFKRGVFSFIGIRAYADIIINDVIQTITSGGLYGIEDDSDPAYIATIESDEITELCNQLSALGFGPRAITRALDDSHPDHHIRRIVWNRRRQRANAWRLPRRRSN